MITGLTNVDATRDDARIGLIAVVVLFAHFVCSQTELFWKLAKTHRGMT